MIRLEVEDKMDPRLLDILKMEFQVHGDDIFFINGPLDLTMLMKVYGIDGYDQFKEPKYKPAAVPAFQNDKDIFQVIREGDVFLHHPYMSFDPVVNFVRQAAKDRMYWQSSKPCIASAAIHPSLRHLLKPQKTASRFPFL